MSSSPFDRFDGRDSRSGAGKGGNGIGKYPARLVNNGLNGIAFGNGCGINVFPPAVGLKGSRAAAHTVHGYDKAIGGCAVIRTVFAGHRRQACRRDNRRRRLIPEVGITFAFPDVPYFFRAVRRLYVEVRVVRLGLPSRNGRFVESFGVAGNALEGSIRVKESVRRNNVAVGKSACSCIIGKT